MMTCRKNEEANSIRNQAWNERRCCTFIFHFCTFLTSVSGGVVGYICHWRTKCLHRTLFSHAKKERSPQFIQKAQVFMKDLRFDDEEMVQTSASLIQYRSYGLQSSEEKCAHRRVLVRKVFNTERRIRWRSNLSLEAGQDDNHVPWLTAMHLWHVDSQPPKWCSVIEGVWKVPLWWPLRSSERIWSQWGTECHHHPQIAPEMSEDPSKVFQCIEKGTGRRKKS